MVFLRGVDVLHVALVIDEVRDGADEVLAGVEDLQHRPSVFAESQPVVELHLSRQTGVVAGHPVQKVRAFLLHVRDALAPALVEDGRVGHAQDDPAFQQRVVLLRFPDHPCLFHRVLSQALVGCAGAAVKLLDAVEPPALVRCIPPHRKRLRETKVVSPPDLPVLRDGERFDDVGPALVFIVVRVVPPLGEHLSRKAVPVSVEQCLLLGLRQRGQCADVARVVFQQRRIVKDGGRDKDAGAPPGDLFPFRRFYLHQLYHPRPGRCRTDKPCLHPAMAYAAGVGRGPDVHPGTGAAGAVAAHDIAVLVPGKVGQLVHADKVEGFALIVVLVLCVVQTAEIDLRPAGEGPAVARAVVPRFGKHRLVVPHGLVDELRKLRVGLAQDERPVVWDVYLPQRLNDQCVALPASGSAPIQSLVLGARHKRCLPRLRRPDHRSSSAPFLLHSVCLPSVARPGASRPAKLFLSRPDFPGLPKAHPSGGAVGAAD